MGKYIFERHFDSDDQMNAILAPLIDCHDPGRIRERSGSVVEYLTWDRGAAGSSLTDVTALVSLSKTH